MAKDTESEQTDSAPEVEQELSQVATNPKQNMLILVGISVVFIYLFFNLFMSSDEEVPNQENTPVPDEVSRPAQVSMDDDVPSIPTLPSPPKLEDPTPPPPPPPSESEPLPVTPTPLSLPSSSEISPVTSSGSADPLLPFGKVQDDKALQRQEKKRKAAIMLIAGTPQTKTADELQQEVDFTYRGDMNLVLGRGKVINAIIETAINTDFGGEIRALVTRDIYSEWGKNILVPKGSRVFGNYATGIDGAYGRISITWTRLDLSNGYTLNLSGSGVDSLGRKGNQGRVDNKFRERFSNAVLRSVFNIALANAIDAAVKPQISSQAAATQNASATNLRNIATGIFTQTSTAANPITADQKIVQICSSTQAAIEDKTSSSFTQIQEACTTLATQANATPEAKLTSLVNTVNTAADSLLQNTNSTVEETKEQGASKQAFTDISDVVKEMIEEQEFTPTITIDQGTVVQIYVNRDYKFPKAAVQKSRLMK